MATLELTSVALSTGVTLQVATAGEPVNPPIILLHGFPESHRTWRHQIAQLAKEHFLIAPDQRGYASSSKPDGVTNYTADKLVADLIALADHFDLGRFTLLGHDWGGAVAWMAALQHPNRVRKLIIVNAPHPFIFQKSLFDDPAQRAASQYITRLRDSSIDKGLVGAELERFFEATFVQHGTTAIAATDKAAYLDEWSQPGAMTAMLNWYRASPIIVPAADETTERPDVLTTSFPELIVPTLVIWGMRDKALLPVQLDGLDALVRDLEIRKIDVGHFAPWEAPEAVTDAIEAWLAR